MTATAGERVNRADVACVKCSGQITAYAGLAVSAWGERYSHRPGQCQPLQGTDLRQLADVQGALFAWSCRKIETGKSGPDSAVPCIASGTDPATYREHMTGHGAKPLAAPRMIKLRKSAPRAAAGLPKIELASLLKYVTWTRRTYSEWTPEHGQVCTETPMRGQVWADGPDPYSVWVLPMPVDGQRQQPVTLYLAGGQAYADWSEARTARREAKRRASYRRAA
jgi:hypothetical protein